MPDSHKQKLVITIDGPGGSGKDSLAENLVASGIFNSRSITIVNTGNFSRAIAYEASRRGISPDHPAFAQTAIDIMHTLDFYGADPQKLHTSDVEKFIPVIATIPEIREGFVEQLPHIIADADADVALILGRITAAVYTQAPVKIFLQTSPEICAHRRALARSKLGQDYEATKQALIERNKVDAVNWMNNFSMPPDMITIDTDALSLKDVCQQTLRAIEPKLAALKT